MGTVYKLPDILDKICNIIGLDTDDLGNNLVPIEFYKLQIIKLLLNSSSSFLSNPTNKIY